MKSIKPNVWQAPLFFLVLLMIAGAGLAGSKGWITPSRPAHAAPFAQTSHSLIYDIDYTSVPDITYKDLTLLVSVGSISSAEVSADGVVIPHQYNAISGTLQFTTDAQSVAVVLHDPADTTNIGQVEKIPLKNDKKWAWSLGFDDNIGLKPTVSMVESFGYRGTLFQIGSLINDTRVEPWIIDKPDMIDYLDDGWSLGNHTWDHNCDPASDLSTTIVDGYNRIVEIVGESNQPDYKVISFAAPCFVAAYHPPFLSLRDAATTTMLFNESGGEFPMVVDADHTADFMLDGKSVYAFNFDRPIARDSRLGDDPANAIIEIDWVASHASPSYHFWHNSLAHGNTLLGAQQVVQHVHDTYGAGGTDEVWIAPSDQIYSYLLTREHAVITLVNNYAGTPTSTPTSTPTNTPTFTPTMLPTSTPTPTETTTETPTPTHTPTGTLTPTVTDTPTPTSTNTPTPETPEPIAIEIANISGVSGYNIGIFGNGFGATQGSATVEILGVQSQIVEWGDDFIQAIVPNVAPGSGQIVVTADSGDHVSAPFTVYTIDPLFLQEPLFRFRNVAYDRSAYITNLADNFCFRQPDNATLQPQEYLFNFLCGFQGINDVGKATFDSPATVAFQAPSALGGNYYVQFFTESNWEPLFVVPADYEIQVSADSSDGIDGTWTTMKTVTNNNRASRLHQITVPFGGYEWLRFEVTDGTGNNGQFGFREIRVYEHIGNVNTPADSFAIYGDSLTVGAFEAIGPTGIATKVKQLRNTSDDLLFSVYGLVGRNSTGLVDGANDSDIYDALALDDMTNQTTYWGIALGTNDSLDGSGQIGVSGSNVEEFDNRLDAIVQELISRNRIPIIARIPETIEALGGFGDLGAKQKILADIDTIAAQYRLIPGPDLYTPFRRNNEAGNGSYFSGDGTHHSKLGNQLLVTLWAEAFVTGIPYSELSDPIASDDGASVDEDHLLNGASVLTNDSDPNNDPLTAILVSTVSSGTLDLHLDGTYLYTPTADYNGSDSFTYRANDGSTDSNIAVVNITVHPLNDAPIAIDDSGSTDEETPVTIDLLANDSDVDGDTLTVDSLVQPANGVAAINLDETVTYTPTTSFSGTDVYTYSISDGNGGTDTAAVTITVSETLQAPGAITQFAPLAAISSATPTYSWDADPVATFYTLVVYRSDIQQIVYYQTYQAAAICAGTSCMVQPSAAELMLVPAQYLWLVRGSNGDEDGPWSLYAP